MSSLDDLEAGYQSSTSSQPNVLDALESNFQSSTQDRMSTNSGGGEKLASGVLGGIASFGDLADAVNNSSYNPISKGVDYLTSLFGGTPEKSDLGGLLRSVIQGGSNVVNDATGYERIPDVTQVDPKSFAHKVGTYLPALLNPEELLAADTVGAAATAAVKPIVNTTLAASGGYAGRQIGEAVGHPDIGEAVGAGAALLTPSAASNLASGTAKVLGSPLTEEQALQQAFKVKGDDALASLNLLKDKGVITEGVLASDTPFKDINAGAAAHIKNSSSLIGTALEDKALKVSDIYPDRSLVSDPNKLVESDISSAIRKAQVDLDKKALIKIDPDNADNIDQVYKDYQNLWEKAKDGDVKAANKYIATTRKIQNTDVDGNMLWDIRQGYDKKINWNSDEFKGQAPIWASLRDNLQGKIIDLTGGDTGEVAGHFNDLSKMFGVQDDLQKLADLEKAGKTQSLPTLLSAIKAVVSPLRSGLGLLEAGARPEDLLNQSFGNTLPQKIAAGSTLPQQILKSVGGTAALGAPAVVGLGTTDQTSSSSSPLSTLLSSIYQAPKGDSMKNKKGEEVTSSDFDAKLNKVAANLEIDPKHLVKAIGFETGGTFDPSVKNKAGSGATGLIQFTPATAKELTGSSTKEAAIKLLSSMSASDQLDYVEKYLSPFKGKIKSLDDLYMAILYPKAVGKDNSYALFKEGTTAYWQNKGLDLDKDGTITKEEAATKVKNFEV